MDGRNSNSSNKPGVHQDIQSDIAVLTSILSQTQTHSEGEGLEDTDIEELLKRMEAADGIAQGVETRLDDLIGNLDSLLGSLESTARGGDPASVKKKGE